MDGRPDFIEIQITSDAEDGFPVSTSMQHRYTSGGRWEGDFDLDSGEQEGAKRIPQRVADLLDDFGLPVADARSAMTEASMVNTEPVQTLVQSYPQVADAAPEFAEATLEEIRPDPRIASAGTVYRLVLDGRWVGILVVSDGDYTLVPIVRMARNESVSKPIAEKAVSKAQQRFMGMVHDQQEHGGSASPEVKRAAKGMSKKDAKDFASTKHKGLPEKVKSESFEQRLIESLFGGATDKLRHTFNRPRTNVGAVPRTGDAVMLTDPFRQGILKISGDRIMATLRDEDDIETKEDLGSLDDVTNALKQRAPTADGARWLSKSYGWEVQGTTRMHDLRLR